MPHVHLHHASYVKKYSMLQPNMVLLVLFWIPRFLWVISSIIRWAIFWIDQKLAFFRRHRHLSDPYCFMPLNPRLPRNANPLPSWLFTQVIHYLLFPVNRKI